MHCTPASDMTISFLHTRNLTLMCTADIADEHYYIQCGISTYKTQVLKNCTLQVHVCQLHSLLSLVWKSWHTEPAVQPIMPSPPACASIIDVPTGVPHCSPSSSAACLLSPLPQGEPGTFTTEPIFFQSCSIRSSNPICLK